MTTVVRGTSSLASGTKVDMEANTSLSIGDIVYTSGYGEEGDGGDNTYEIVAALTL